VGTHRYIFLLYQQPFQEPLQAEDPSGGDAGKRSNFKVKHWAKEHGLGDPVRRPLQGTSCRCAVVASVAGMPAFLGHRPAVIPWL
jgi:hypothetical protein